MVYGRVGTVGLMEDIDIDIAYYYQTDKNRESNN